ncbi:hypothetical protein QQZ08_003994 [Neonectria magnoliae]|uniref:Kinesin-like protein n=1 Tax=Neonectria magnoliae TaxID=2732573 RepID=A0ABR1I749_9HYPO
MEQYLLDNIPRYRKLVSAFRPKPARRPAPDAPAPVPVPDMLVAARLRPLLPDDGILPPALFPRPAEPGVLDVHELRQPPRGPALLRSFNFQVDRIYQADAPTEDIYVDAVKPLVPWAWNGGIGTLFAYGQTGSGKTHTVSHMERLVADEMLGGSLDGERNVYVTIIELAGNAAHGTSPPKGADDAAPDPVPDLLNARRSVSVLEDSFGITQLNGALEHHVTTPASMLALVNTATSFRRTEATDKNSESSRSHAVCRIRVHNPAAAASDDGVLYLVDLAGSEAARDTTHHTAQRMRETREINASLSVLKDCIRGKAEADALAGSGGGAGSRRKPHVPFRQSALTKILKHVFDPATQRPCKTVVVACVNPSLADVEPSKNTLRYAETLRVLLPKTTSPRYDPRSPTTWTNAQLREWIKDNSGKPPVDAAMLAPTESGPQLLRLPAPEFEARCLKTASVAPEQAKSFRSKLWQMHIDAKRAPAKQAGTPDADLQLRQTSQDPDPKALSVPFKERIRPGMVVSWTPPAGSPMALPGMNMVVVLSPAPTVANGVSDVPENGVSQGYTDTGPKGPRYLCAMVTPAIMSEAYDLHLWRQVVVDVERMDTEVFLEYDVATRYYYIAI